MASHSVSFTLPERSLGKADVSFAIRKDHEKLGELKVSNGSAVWFPKNGKQGYRMSWTQLNELFLAHGIKAETR